MPPRHTANQIMPGQTETDAHTVIAGRKPVLEALRLPDGQIEKVLLQSRTAGRAVEEIRAAARSAGVQVQYVPANRLDQEARGANHQGVVALRTPIGYVGLEELLGQIAPGPDEVRAKKPLLIMLDQIEDPHNFGAILRSAVAFGVEGVLVPPHHMAPLNAAAIKASAGTAARIPIARTGNLHDAIEQLKERGYWVAGAAGEGTTSVRDMDWDRPLVIVIGSEGKGLRPRIREACDYLVSIPLPGPAESLNASVAAGIFLYAAARLRAASPE